MGERRQEINRRRKRAEKLAVYKTKLATAKDGKEKDDLLKKIRRISPWWQEPVAS